MPRAKLIEAILRRSEAVEWDEAVKEWECDGITHVDDEPCLCGEVTEIENCELRNKKNFNRVLVGICCAQHFLGPDCERLFPSCADD